MVFAFFSGGNLAALLFLFSYRMGVIGASASDLFFSYSILLSATGSRHGVFMLLDDDGHALQRRRKWVLIFCLLASNNILHQNLPFFDECL